METKPPLKRCGKCGDTKPAIDFNRNRAQRDGLNCWCRTCHSKWLEANSRLLKGYRRKHLYGITEQQFLDIVEAQGGKCRICRCEFSTLGEEPHVDHDHTWGIVRSILCRRCNYLVGYLERCRAILPAALDYVLESDKQEIGGAT